MQVNTLAQPPIMKMGLRGLAARVSTDRWRPKMHPRTCIVMASAITFGSALFLGAARADEPIQVGGKMTCKTTEQHSVPVGGDPGHVLVVQIETCVGSASGESARFDGGQQTWFELDDLVRGSGMIHGYELAKYKDGSTGTTSYAGAQVATMINGKPEWTALGTFEQMRGTGSMVNVQIRGTWTAKPISETEFVMDWVGTMTDGSKQ
jgi:hypothetical protein